MEINRKIYVMNTTIIPNEGIYVVERIDVNKAKELLKDGFVSAIGHKGTAKVMSDLLGIEIPVNRVMVEFGNGDRAVCFKLKQRLPEGKVLTAEELKSLEYEWYLIERVLEVRDYEDKIF